MSETPSTPAASGRALWRSAIGFAQDVARFSGRRGIVGLALVLAAAALESVGVVLLVPFLVAVTGDAGAPAFAATILAGLGLTSRLARLGALLSAFAALMVIRVVVVGARARSLLALRIGFVEQRRIRLLRRLAAASWESVARLQHGRVGHIVHIDVAHIGLAVGVVLDSAVAVILGVNQALLALWLAPAFTLACLGGCVVAAPLALRLLKKSYGSGAEIGKKGQDLHQALGQFLGALKLALSQNLEASFLARFEAAIAAIVAGQTAFALQQSDSQQLFSLATGFLGCLAAFVAFGLFDMPAPVVFALLVALGRLAGPVQTLMRAGQQFAHALSAYERVCGLERDLLQRDESADDAPVPAPEGPIRFRAVGYLHESGVGLRDFDLEIAPGEIVGVAGPSGAGKTTFADLLVGLVAPQTGVILIGEAPLRGGVLTAWRSRLAYVAQDAFLFHDTLRANLLWGSPDASDAQIAEALSIAGAQRLVEAMPEGLATIVGERGARLSGGERQRIALARALLRRPMLLVLDEATSALDLATEADILARLAALDCAPTIVVIAHRPESLRICGRILRFADGRLVGVDAQ